MNTLTRTIITVVVTINAPVEKVWQLWTDPEHIVSWNNASDDWHTPKAENDLRAGGSFLYRMESIDGIIGFDFAGVYTKVNEYRQIEYILGDNRKVQVTFSSKGDSTTITEAFEAENENSVELQRDGWQAILDNFKRYVEVSGKREMIHFEIEINASPEKVYNTMLDKKGYTEWTEVFNPTSHFVGSWDKGSKILFLGTNEDGSTAGMVSKIRENIPYKYVSIEHLGFVEDGKEVLSGPKVESWTRAHENYRFIDDNGITVLEIDADVTPEFRSYFEDTWPKALNKLKSICEGK